MFADVADAGEVDDGDLKPQPGHDKAGIPAQGFLDPSFVRLQCVDRRSNDSHNTLLMLRSYSSNTIAGAGGVRLVLDEFLQVLHGTPRFQKQFGAGKGQDGEDGLVADGREDDVAILALDVDLVQHAAPQFGGDSLS